MRMREHAEIKKAQTAMNKNLFIIFLIYSFVVHASAVIACTGYFDKNSQPLLLSLDKKIKIPYAQFVSLTGRKGNSYDRSKISVKADPDKIRSFFSETLEGLKGYIDEKRSEAAKKQAINKELENRIVEKTKSYFDLKEKLTYAGAQVERILSSMKKYKPVEKTPAVKKTVSVKRSVIENDARKSKMPKKEKTSKAAEAETKDLEAWDSGRVGSGSNGLARDAKTVEVFGNMSGNEAEGDRVAGAPHGEMDPSIEASKIDMFKSIVSEKIMARMKYPERCRRYGIEGTARLRFEIRPDGMLESAEISGTSGDGELDGSALEAVKCSQPFIPFPREIKKNIAFSIPLVYKIRR